MGLPDRLSHFTLPRFNLFLPFHVVGCNTGSQEANYEYFDTIVSILLTYETLEVEILIFRGEED